MTKNTGLIVLSTMVVVAIFIVLIFGDNFSIERYKLSTLPNGDHQCGIAPQYDHMYWQHKTGKDTMKCDHPTSCFMCNNCGGDYLSVRPKRDRYYQPEQGYMGDTILSGFPYYKAY